MGLMVCTPYSGSPLRLRALEGTVPLGRHQGLPFLGPRGDPTLVSDPSLLFSLPACNGL